MAKRNSAINNSDQNLRGGSSMDEFIKKKDEKIAPFMVQSNTLVPATGYMIVDDKQNRSIITLENADLQVQFAQEETDEKMSTI